MFATRCRPPVAPRLSWLGALCAVTCTVACAGLGSDEDPDDQVRSVPPESHARPPHVLVLLTDDQTADSLSALGAPDVRTPAMDRLVESGTAFTAAYVQGSIHGAVCMPSRAMLLTGRHLAQLPESVTQTWSVPAEQRGACEFPTLPEVFADAGYQTFVAGKWHNGAALLARGFEDGGAIFFGGMSDHDAVPVRDFDPAGEYAQPARPGEAFSSELFVDATLDFLERRDEQRPFFAWLAFTAPHDPRMAPQPWASEHAAADQHLPPNLLPEHPFPIPDLQVRDERLAPHPRTPEVVAEHRAAYHAMVAHLDAQIGRLLDDLAARDLLDDTLIVLAGDNGLALGSHGLLGKQSVYEHSARVPLVLAGPGVPRGERRAALAWLHDAFPTVCELAGVPVPDSVQSRSLVPALRDPGARVRDVLATSYTNNKHERVDGVLQPRGGMRALRDARYKLLLANHDGVRTTRLFDLVADRWETTDLSTRPEHVARVAAMRARLAAELAELGDPADLDAPDWALPPTR